MVSGRWRLGRSAGDRNDGSWLAMSKTEEANLLFPHTRASRRKGERERGGVGDCSGGQTAAYDRQTAAAVAGNGEGRQRREGGKGRAVSGKKGGFSHFSSPFSPFFLTLTN